MVRWCRVAVVAACLAVVHAAAAQEAPSTDAVKKAADEFSEGKRAYRSGDYAEAAEHFEAADESAPTVNAIRAAMTSREKAGQLDRAATLAALAVSRYPEDEVLLGEVDAILGRADQELFRVTVRCKTACGIVVGTSLVPGKPARERLLYLSPGDHDVSVTFEGQETQTRAVSGEAGSESELEFAVEEEEPEAAPAAQSEPTGDIRDVELYFEDEEPKPAQESENGRGGLPKGVFVVGALATVGLAGTTVWSGIDTQTNPGSDAVANDPECQQIGTRCDAYQEGEKKEKRTNALIGATAGVGAITIVVALLTDWRGKRRKEGARSTREGARVSSWWSVDHGAAVGVQGRF